MNFSRDVLTKKDLIEVILLMIFFVIYKIEVSPGTYLHPPQGEGKG